MFHQSHFPNAHTIDTRAFDFLALCVEKGIDARLVGGCVRDALLGQVNPHSTVDIDIAIACTPAELITLCEKNGIKYFPTGIDHGTITLLYHRLLLQVTSLRADVKTTGRHASVIYGTSFEKDACRRDFTINALYVDHTHILYDAFEGITDLAKGSVRFIGEPIARIREDYLRLYRYFRFWERFGRGPADVSVLPTFDSIKENLKLLSIERVQHELLLILSRPWPGIVIASMHQYGLFKELFNNCVAPNYETIHNLRRLIMLEHAITKTCTNLKNTKFCPIRRLSILTKGADLTAHLKLSRIQTKKLKAISPYCESKSIQPETIAMTHPEYWIDAHVLSLAASNKSMYACCKAIKNMQMPPPFPLKGSDIMSLEMTGVQIGSALKLVKQQWIISHFTMDYQACLNFARELCTPLYRGSHIN
jgi:poly(A) polymerase